MTKSNRKGFTLLELLVVIAIIGLLASVIGATLSRARASARDTKRVQDLNTIASALENFAIDNNRYPLPSEIDADIYNFDRSSYDDDFLDILVSEGYLTSVPRDPLNTGWSPWEAGQYLYAYGASPSGRYYMLISQLENPDHPESAQYKCGRWTGGWPMSEEDFVFGIRVTPSCCPSPYTYCTGHAGMDSAYVVNSVYP
ncbi:MAG: prepilin-type N-terminal cleavage/methylation domain-containing protein [Parcubacteria group bacterium]|nr:prepilin-type N-terminal cleavage/methylation domain-containing protein [Parcubacteria group bacterium]MCR4342623.1 prepilin-type N-terminal cleavage/methylation domain-containing protein [Patescibacteria group bacterium]